MDTWNLTTERVVALVIVVLNVVAALVYSHVSKNLGIVAGSAFALSLPGLAIIWFREALSVTGFDRGVLHESPPLFLDVIGWAFLIALPIIFLGGFMPSWTARAELTRRMRAFVRRNRKAYIALPRGRTTSAASGLAQSGDL
jgi:hypothetical protein